MQTPDASEPHADRPDDAGQPALDTLLRRSAEGDRAAFSAFYDATVPWVHGLAEAMFGPGDDAAEARWFAEAELDAFEEKWAGKYASIAPAWRRAWAEVIPFFAFDPAIRKIIYTTNAIESLNRVIRKSIKTRGSFPTDEAATKLIYLAIRSFEKDGRNVREWFAARNQFAIMFGERFDA